MICNIFTTWYRKGYNQMTKKNTALTGGVFFESMLPYLSAITSEITLSPVPPTYL
ncbi:MAG: hypothetical protein JWR05_2947 [Mucilaginibacter sp.]|nr:hypothetical protein [Mucilaginibacter sp.]